MSFLGLFGGDSSSSTSTANYDNKIGADNGGVAVREGGTVTIGSDNVANNALNASQNFLATSTDFLDKQITNVLTILDHRGDAADMNAQAAQKIASEAINQSQSTDTDKILKFITVVLVAGVAIVAIKSGVIKI